MNALIGKLIFLLKNTELFILVLIGQMLVFFVSNQTTLRSMNLIQFFNNYNFCNYVIMTVVFIMAISMIADTERENNRFKLRIKIKNNKKLIYINKFISILKLMFFSSLVTFIELLVLVNKFWDKKYSYFFILKQSIYPMLGFLPFFVLQFSIAIFINKKGVSFASGVMGYFLGVLGSIGVSLKTGIFNLWAYPFYTAPVITDSVYGFSVENNKSVILIIISIALAAVMFYISLRFCEKEQISIS